MSGFTCVISLRDSESGRAHKEGEQLAAAYQALRPRTPPGPRLDDPLAHVVAFGRCEVTADERGWTVRQGVLHGPPIHPMSSGDVPSVDGQGSLVSVDLVSGTTVVATDRFAAAPVYVSEAGGLLYCSTSALAMARHLSPAVDQQGLSNFLVGGYQLGPRTHWEGIRRLEPGTLLEVTSSRGVQEEVYWRPHTDPEIERLGLDDAVDRVIDVATETFRERLGSAETWIDLTGGYDSRMLALLLERAGVPFSGNTRMATTGPDVTAHGGARCAHGVAMAADPATCDWPTLQPELVDHTLGVGDGRLEVLQLSRVVWAHQELARTRTSLLSAGGGEHHQFYAWQSELLRSRRTPLDLGRWVDMIALKPADLAALRPGLREEVRADLLETFGRWVAPYHAEPKTRQLDACYAYKGSGHFGAYRAADDVDLTAQLPFFFEPVFTTAFSLDARRRAGFKVMRAVIHRLNPRAAGVQTTRGGPATPMRASSAAKYLPMYGQLARKGFNKVTEQMVGRPLWAYPDRWGDRDSAEGVVQRLQETGVLDWRGLRVGPLLSADGVERLRKGEVDRAMLGRIITAEMALASTGSGL